MTHARFNLCLKIINSLHHMSLDLCMNSRIFIKIERMEPLKSKEGNSRNNDQIFFPVDHNHDRNLDHFSTGSASLSLWTGR